MPVVCKKISELSQIARSEARTEGQMFLLSFRIFIKNWRQNFMKTLLTGTKCETMMQQDC